MTQTSTPIGRVKFGACIRQAREAKEVGLREMAKRIGVSSTYLSKIERDEFPPPAEGKVKAIAAILGFAADDLLARAGRVSSDIADIIKRHPVELAALVRTTEGLTLGNLLKVGQFADDTLRGGTLGDLLGPSKARRKAPRK